MTPLMDIVPALDHGPLYGTHCRPGLACISYGRAIEGTLFVPVRQLGVAPLVESWLDREGLMFDSISVVDASPLESSARAVYERAIVQARATGHPHFIRMWNYVGSINDFDDGAERYQLFCAGRHEAFAAAGWKGSDLPAASAVGMPGRGLLTYFLASREPGRQIENPRQMSAYEYPVQYGPKSPSFARATLWGDTLFVSGTSSIVGHATIHEGDVAAQLDETLRNIETVIAQALGGSLSNVIAAKTYLRHAADFPLVSRRLSPLFRNSLFLEADICRKELLIEIEVVAQR